MYGTLQVEVDERHAASRTCLGDREVRGRRRLPLLLDRARDDDRADVGSLEAGELDVGSQHAERLGVRPRRLRQHDEPVLGDALRRRWDARELGQAEPLTDLARRPNARVERIDEERQAEPEDDAEDEAEHRVLPGRRRDLAGAFRRSDHVGPRGLQRLERRELLILVAQADGELGADLAVGLQLLELLCDLGSGPANRVRVELATVRGEGLCI